jgi:type IV pilus assembly protein PilC
MTLFKKKNSPSPFLKVGGIWEKMREKTQGKVRKAELLDLYYCLEQFILAGVPLGEILRAFPSFSYSSPLASILKGIETCLLQGGRISQAFALYPKVFDPFTIGLLAISEKTGDLGTILGILRDQLSKSVEVKQRIHHALLYPACILVILLGTVGLLSLYLIPSLLTMMNTLNHDLPMATRVFLNMLTSLKEHGFVYMGAIAGGICLLKMGLGVYEPLRFFWSFLIYKTPIIGGMWWIEDNLQLIRGLHLMIKSQVPLLQAFKLLPSLFNNAYFKSCFAQIFSQVEEGYSLSVAWEQSPLKNPFLLRLLKAGEETGTLPSSLAYMEKVYEQQLKRRGEICLSLLQPLLLSCIGGGMIFILFAVVSPFYETLGGVE